MIATLMTWPYGTLRGNKARCLIFGFQENIHGGVKAVVADLKTGEMSIVDFVDVIVDVDKLRKLPL